MASACALTELQWRPGRLFSQTLIDGLGTRLGRCLLEIPLHSSHNIYLKQSYYYLLEQDFAHFGYPHTIVTDNSTSLLSKEFQTWCRERGIVHLTGAPYHPATNGAAEHMVQTFKQALSKSTLSPKAALQEFLMQYQRTPLAEGYSPSEILNGRQIRSKIDILLPSPAHIAQGKQAKSATKSQLSERHQQVEKVTQTFKIGSPCYALYCGPRREKEPRWVPAVVTKVFGSRSFNVHVFPKGVTWRRHLEQLRPRHGNQEDDDPRDTSTHDSNSSYSSLEESNSDTLSGQDMLSESPKPMPTPQEPFIPEPKQPPNPKPRNPRLPTGGDYSPENLRRSTWIKK